MNGLERTLAFLAGTPVDRPPFHPIIMRFAALHAAVKYGEFCRKPEAKCGAMTLCADDFGLDWVTVMSDPYAEAEGYGLQVNYPENDLPHDAGHLIRNPSDICQLEPLVVMEHARMRARVEECRRYAETVGDRLFIVGWVEGPIAEYVDLRGLTETCLDLYDRPEMLRDAFAVMVESAKRFITAQVEAGAHAIGIGDAACSQIGPGFYRDLVWEGEKALVDHIHSLGAIAKLHICGNTSDILKDMIATGADIVDIDHLVGDMSPYVEALRPGQVLCGNSDPVSVIQQGTQARILQSVNECWSQTQGRGIVSAGCEITPETSSANFRAYAEAAHALRPRSSQ